MLSIFHFFSLLFVLWYLLSYDAVIVVLRRGVRVVGLSLVGREALLDGVLGVLVLGVLFQTEAELVDQWGEVEGLWKTYAGAFVVLRKVDLQIWH